MNTCYLSLRCSPTEYVMSTIFTRAGPYPDIMLKAAVDGEAGSAMGGTLFWPTIPTAYHHTPLHTQTLIFHSQKKIIIDCGDQKCWKTGLMDRSIRGKYI